MKLFRLTWNNSDFKIMQEFYTVPNGLCKPISPVYRRQIYISNAYIYIDTIITKMFLSNMISRLELNILFKNKYLKDLIYFKRQKGRVDT